METLIARVSYYDYDAEKLIQARKATGFSQDQVAQQTGMVFVTLCRIEKKRSASFNAVERLCEFYGLPLSEVVSPVDTPAGLHPSRNNFLRKSTQRVKTS